MTELEFIRQDALHLRRSAEIALCFVVLVWGIWLLSHALGLELQFFGIHPRQMEGLIGILFAPLIHGSLAHLLANTAPLFILGAAFLYMYPKSSVPGLTVIYLVSGMSVWLFGRNSFHIGASGFIYGMMFFLFFIGILRRDRRSIAASLIVFFLYGSMVWGILPVRQEVSFEYHLAGAVIGTLVAFTLRWRDPPGVDKKYDWEDEETDDNFPFDSS